MFGLTFEKLLLIGVVAVFVLGPEKVPHYTAKLAQFVRQLKTMAEGAKERMRDELGPEFDDVDWQQLDPRKYDPRRIIREALSDDPAAPSTTPAAPITVARESAYAQRERLLGEGRSAPFDEEAT